MYRMKIVLRMASLLECKDINAKSADITLQKEELQNQPTLKAFSLTVIS